VPRPHDQPVGLEAQVRDLEGSELRAPQCAGEPDQEQRAVAATNEVLGLDIAPMT
jgi:hypothetical protein